MADTQIQIPVPKIDDNPDGWGPMSIPENFQKLPYQTFNKADKIGKIADWTGQDKAYQDRRYGRFQHQQQYSSGYVGQQYAYYHDDDDMSFQLVDTSRPQRTMQQRQMKSRNQQQMRKQIQRERERKAQAGYATANRGRGAYSARGTQRGRGGRWDQQRNQRNRGPPSVQVHDDWVVLEDLDYVRLNKLSLPKDMVGDGEDINGHQYGTLQYYDKGFDRVTTKAERPLEKCGGNYYNFTTTDDPVIRQLAKEGVGNVFATDILIAALMCATRSFYSWDIVVHRIEDKLFFDKRSSCDGWVYSPDAVTVSETNQDPPSEDSGINSPKSLAQEAWFVNQTFKTQVLRRGPDDQPATVFEHPQIPFADEEDKDNTANLAYKYRKFNLGRMQNGTEINLVCRTEHDGVMQGPNGETQFLTIKAFNEYDATRGHGYIDWRSKLDTQKGAVIATELKNNNFKLAKWNVQAILANSHFIKIGFVSRVNMRDSSKHVILGTQHYSPSEFAANITLDMSTCWGILRCVIDLCMKQEPGKYLLMKEAGKNVVRLYKLPPGTFEDEEEADDEDDESESGEEEPTA